MKKTLFTLVLIIAVVLAGCTQTVSPDMQEDEKIVIVTTLFPLYDFAKEVGGDKVEVTLLLPPGAEPHSFEPKPSDIKTIENADVFLYIGEIMEPWAHDLLEGVQNEQLQIVDASSLVTLLEAHHDEHEEDMHEEDHEAHEEEHEHHENEMHEDDHAHEEDLDAHDEHEEEHDEDEMHEHEHEEQHDDHEGHDHDHGMYDPHIWLDLGNDQVIVNEIATVLGTINQENKAYYTARAQAYVSELATLDTQYKTQLATCAKDEFLVGGHNFFGYIEHRYNIEGIAVIENLEPHTEPTPKRMQEIIDVANKHDMKYILTEVLVSTQMAEAIAEETGATLLTFNPAPNLAKEDFNNGVRFLDVMNENLDTLTTALECN